MITGIREWDFPGHWFFDGSKEEMLKVRDMIISRYPGQGPTDHIWKAYLDWYMEICTPITAEYLELFI